MFSHLTFFKRKMMRNKDAQYVISQKTRLSGVRGVTWAKTKMCFRVIGILFLFWILFYFPMFSNQEYKFRFCQGGNYTSKINLFDGLPSITLTIRSSSQPGLLQFLYCTALRTAVLYWSQDIGSIGIILDKESKNDSKLAESLRRHQETMGIHFKIYYEALPHDPTIFTRIGRRNPGYNRQIFSSFLMDLFIQTDVIAWIDADGKFTSPVTKDNIINNGKLRAKGMDTFKYKWVNSWSKSTEKMIGHPMISDFMTYFPVYIWTDTVKNCRKYILKHMNVTSIETAFMKTGPGGDLSPVNVIMTYAYYFEHSRYDWHIGIRNISLDAYNKKHATRGHELTPAHLKPEVHVSIHEKYYTDPSNTVNKKAYCMAIKNTKLYGNMADSIKQMCQPFRNDTMWEIFRFCNVVDQQHVTTWCKDNKASCIKLIDEQYSRVHDLVDSDVYTLNLTKVSAVENAAKDMGVKCPPLF